LKVWDNLSDEEIKEITGLTKGNIKVLVSRARKKIKELYQKDETQVSRYTVNGTRYTVGGESVRYLYKPYAPSPCTVHRAPCPVYRVPFTF
jgi:hypothetical protein